MGKTSTKDILAAICEPQRRTVAAERSYNAEIGVPLTIGRVEPDTELCILELAMRGFGQIAELCAFARPDVGVVTNVGPVHLEHVGDLDGVTRAKGELIDALPAGGAAVVPAGFPVGRTDLEVVRVGEDVVARVLRRRRCSVTSLGTVEVDFTARHLAANALTAIAVARVLGLDLPARLEVAFTEWRNQELPLPGGGVLINDAWNANPVSMRAGARPSRPARARAGGRSRCSATWPSSAPTATRATARWRRAVEELGIDVVVAIGSRARAYGGRQVATVEEALVVLDELLGPGDCVLVKGARAMGLERVAEALTSATAGGTALPRGRVVDVLIATIVAMVISIVAGPRFIAFLRLREYGQQIREEGPAGHVVKQGTPTMGGLLILFAAIVPYVILSNYSTPALTVFFCMVGCGTIGFLDDFVKLTHRRSLGLNGRWKLLLLGADHRRRRPTRRGTSRPTSTCRGSAASRSPMRGTRSCS